MQFWNKTKIIATVGPASASKVELRAMIKGGVDIFRINGAHGSDEEHKRTISLIRGALKAEKAVAAILFDLPGPKMRLGKLKSESAYLKKGDTIVLHCGKKVQVGSDIPVCDKFVATSVKYGSRLFINDGIVEVLVKNVSGSKVTCRVVSGGEIRSRKGLNLPRVKLPIPSLTKRDKTLLDFAVEEKVDYVGLSFVRSAKNVTDLKRIIMNKNSNIGVIAKIEKPEALDEIEKIVSVSDGVMVARGDLGIEMPFDEIPVIQKRIIGMCRMKGVPVITATQMMESMVNSARPTRAEAADVAVAVWEGTDAVMLSEETSIGQNPAKAVRAMAKIAEEAEKEHFEKADFEKRSDANELQAQMISMAAGILADELGAGAIVTPTRSGRTALYISSTRPQTKIIAPTEDENTARRMSLYWGVRPVIMPTFSTVDEMLDHAEEISLKFKMIKRGDRIVITSGAHGSKDDITRLVEVRQV